MTNFLMLPHNLNEALRLRQKDFEGFNDIKPHFSTLSGFVLNFTFPVKIITTSSFTIVNVHTEQCSTYLGSNLSISNPSTRSGRTVPASMVTQKISQ